MHRLSIDRVWNLLNDHAAWLIRMPGNRIKIAEESVRRVTSQRDQKNNGEWFFAEE